MFHNRVDLLVNVFDGYDGVRVVGFLADTEYSEKSVIGLLSFRILKHSMKQ